MGAGRAHNVAPRLFCFCFVRFVRFFVFLVDFWMPVSAIVRLCRRGTGRAHNVALRHRTIRAPADSELLLAASQPFRPVRSGKGSDVTMVFDGSSSLGSAEIIRLDSGLIQRLETPSASSYETAVMATGCR